VTGVLTCRRSPLRRLKRTRQLNNDSLRKASLFSTFVKSMHKTRSSAALPYHY
jgi:hypothetical protein